jgi:hypothetical protein
MKSRHGCLTLLALFTLVMAVLARTATPDDADARIAVLGFFLLALIYIGSGMEWLTTRSKQQGHGFPVVMNPPEAMPPPPPDADQPRD